MNLKEVKYFFASILIITVLLVLVGEVGARIFGATSAYEYDRKLGWAPKKSFSMQKEVTDQSGEKYLVDFSTNEHGFREFGRLDNGKTRILFVGDSWTGDPNTSDEEAYFGVVKNNLPVEVFAIGGGGYGTLQELMLVQEYAELIRPDIFVLQYCDNDLVNNSFSLEGNSIVRNQKNFRPYWVDGEIAYRKSESDPFVFLFKHSRLFRSLDAVLTVLQFNLYKSYFPPRYQAYDGTAPAGSPEVQAEIDTRKSASISATRFLMSEMKKCLPPETKLVTFPASADDPEELEIWRTLAEETGFLPYPSVAFKVEEAERSGEVVRVRDGAHWNRLGNRIAGDELVRILQRDFL